MPADERADRAAAEPILCRRTLDSLVTALDRSAVADLASVTAGEVRAAAAALSAPPPDAAALRSYQRRAHSLKATAATYGALRLAGLAETLEQAAGRGDIAAVRTAAAALAPVIDQSAAALDAWAAAG